LKYNQIKNEGEFSHYRRANAIDRKPIAAHMQVQTGTGCFMLRALGNPTLNQT
jgi:hypothetical protein